MKKEGGGGREGPLTRFKSTSSTMVFPPAPPSSHSGRGTSASSTAVPPATGARLTVVIRACRTPGGGYIARPWREASGEKSGGRYNVYYFARKNQNNPPKDYYNCVHTGS